MKRIVLASASPRRKELLKGIGLNFEVDPGDYVEDVYTGLEPHTLAKSISLGKARTVASRHKTAIIIAADTVIFFQNKIMGKPHTEAEARRMLTALNGNSHSVITGFTILDTDESNITSQSVETKVYIKPLAAKEIDVYIKSGEPLDKAGAYAIQGLGAVIVERIEGDYSNVVGLPLNALAKALKGFGVHIL